MKILKKILIILVFLAALIVMAFFYVQNSQSVNVDLLLQTVELSLGMGLLLSFLVGCILGLLVSTPTILLLKSQLGSARKRLEQH